MNKKSPPPVLGSTRVWMEEFLKLPFQSMVAFHHAAVSLLKVTITCPIHVVQQQLPAALAFSSPKSLAFFPRSRLTNTLAIDCSSASKTTAASWFLLFFVKRLVVILSIFVFWFLI